MATKNPNENVEVDVSEVIDIDVTPQGEHVTPQGEHVTPQGEHVTPQVEERE